MEQNEIIELLSNMTVKQLADLASSLEEEWGVTAAAAVQMVAGGGGDGGGAAAEEQTEFDVMLTSFGDKKIGVIKVVRGVTGLGLKEAKELVEGVPSAIKQGVSKEEAADIVAQITEAGGSAEAK